MNEEEFRKKYPLLDPPPDTGFDGSSEPWNKQYYYYWNGESGLGEDIFYRDNRWHKDGTTTIDITEATFRKAYKKRFGV